MKRGQLGAVLIIVLLVGAVGAFMIFSQKRAGKAAANCATDWQCPKGMKCIGGFCHGAMGGGLVPGGVAPGGAAPGGVVNPCGNGKLDAGEECDDGNIIDGDGCSSTCKLEGGAPLGGPVYPLLPGAYKSIPSDTDCRVSGTGKTYAEASAAAEAERVLACPLKTTCTSSYTISFGTYTVALVCR